MSFLKKLFGGAADAPAKPEPSETYNGFKITPVPMKEGSEYRISCRVEKELGGEMKTHHLIRADTLGSADAANAASIAKAKQLIDQMGDRLF